MGLKDKLKNTMNFKKIDENDISCLIKSGLKEITLKKDIELSKTIIIDQDDITIDGNNHTIDARNKQILFITSNNITLKNIVFRNAHSKEHGGAIYNKNGRLKIIECKFIDNHTDSDNGGALYNDNGHVIIDECEFRENTARFGGAIYNGKTLKAIFTTFLNNYSSKGLSIFNSTNSNLTLENCNFKRHKDSRASEIYNMGIMSIKSFQKELFEEITEGGFIHINSRNSKPAKYLDELIHSGKKEIKLDFDIEFDQKDEIILDVDNIRINGTGHRIDGFGKSNIFNVTGENITLTNIDFRNGTSENGGAILNKSNSLYLFNCNFNCNISANGGAIANEGYIHIEKCDFAKNIANENHGGAILNYGELKLRDCNFSNNLAKNNGGAIDNNKSIKIKDCYFKSNISENGAGIYNKKSVKLVSCNFDENKAFKQGSVLYNRGCSEMKKCEFQNNVSNMHSNIIFQDGNEKNKLTIEKCIFQRDSFNNNLIMIENGFCEVKSSKFILKKEDDSYIIYNKNAAVELKNLEIERADDNNLNN